MPLGLVFGQGGLDGCVCGSKGLGIEFDSHVSMFLKLQVFQKSFICAERQTDRRTDRQTDKNPQPCSENKPFGKPLVASRQKKVEQIPATKYLSKSE